MQHLPVMLSDDIQEQQTFAAALQETKKWPKTVPDTGFGGKVQCSSTDSVGTQTGPGLPVQGRQLSELNR